MPKYSKTKEMNEQRYGLVHVVKYIIIAFVIYCAAAFMNGIVRGALETSRNQVKPMNSIFSNYEVAQAVKTPANTEFISVPKSLDALEVSTLPISSDSNVNQEEDVNGKMVFTKSSENVPIDMSKEAQVTSQHIVSGTRNISTDKLKESFILPTSEIEKAIAGAMSEKSNTNEYSSCKSTQNVLSNDQYISKFSVEETRESIVGENINRKLNNSHHFEEFDEMLPRNSQESLANTKPTTSIQNISENQIKDLSNRQSVSPFSQVESGKTVAMDSVYNEVSSSIENILADLPTEPFIPPFSVVEDPGWRTMPIKTIYDESSSSEKENTHSSTKDNPRSQIESGKTVALDRVINEMSNRIENILVDQQTEPFIPPPSVVEETGWRTIQIKTNNDESSSSEVQNTNSSAKDNSEMRSTVILSKPTENDKKDLTETSQRNAKSKSDSHESKE